MLKGRGEGSSRKPRLFIDSGDAKDEEESDDPVAAALAARKRKQEQALKAAAAAAAKAAAANVITYFAPDPPAKSAQAEAHGSKEENPQAIQNGLSHGDDTASSGAGVGAASASPADAQDGGNPLASLLGYSGDDGSGSEAGDATPEREPPAEHSGPKAASDDNDSSIDAELASFMEELESSGLLKEGPDGEANGGHDEEPFKKAATSPSAAMGARASADADQPLPESTAGTAAAGAEANEGDASTEEGPGDLEPVQDAGAAEQRVLGSLTGCPGWHEVMDMASGKVYFWNEANNDVAWDPPAGSQPRSEGENEAVFAAAHAAPGEGPSGASDEAATDCGEQKEHAPSIAAPAAVQALSTIAELPGHDRQAAGTEEGELAADASQIPKPDESIEQAAQELLTQAWGAAERLCGPAPLLVRLAVEAEVRLRDWRALAAAQRAAAEAGDAGASLSWEAYQGSARASLELLQGALPGALQEAQAASAKAAAAMAAASVQAEAALEDGEDAEPAPAMPEKQPPIPAEDHAVAMDTTEDVPRTQAPAPTSMQPVSQAPVSASIAAAPFPSTSDALPQPQGASAAVDPLVAQINSRIAAAAAGQSAAAAAHTAAASLPRPVMPVMAPLPAIAPQWPGYYQPHLSYAYPHMPYPYMPFPVPYLQSHAHSTASAAMAQAPQPEHCAAEAAATIVEIQPPLPQDDQPPLPSSLPEQEILPASASAPTKQTEYRAEPVRAPTPPAAEAELAEPPGEPSIPIIPPEEESKKRKAKKNPAVSAKRRATVKVGSLAPSVLNKWAAARKDLEEKEEAEEELDADAVERKRAREAEEWRLKQLRSGVSSQQNSNFQPLAVDWREKIKAARGKPAEAPKAAVGKPKPVTYASKPDLEALSVGLPPGWKALWDKKSGEIYYGNPTTKETSWEKPK